MSPPPRDFRVQNKGSMAPYGRRLYLRELYHSSFRNLDTYLEGFIHLQTLKQLNCSHPSRPHNTIRLDPPLCTWVITQAPQECSPRWHMDRRGNSWAHSKCQCYKWVPCSQRQLFKDLPQECS